MSKCPNTDERPFILVRVAPDHLWYGPVEEYLRCVVPAETYPVSWPAATGLGQSHPEALKAQAVAARSYAMWRIEHPREQVEGGVIHIWGDTRDQAFDEGRVHENTDAAIQATEGVRAVNNVCRYVSRCGREDCPYCQGTGGHAGTTWSGRMCQHGAQLLATQGKTWREILRHYYGEIQFSDETEVINMDCKTPYKDPATDSFQMQGGRVTGCRVDIIRAEDTPGKPKPQTGQYVYRCVSLRFLNEEQARGDTRIMVSVLDRNGQAQMAKIINAWPQQKMPNWDEAVYDWASPGRWAEFAQGGGNYDPSRHGPLGPYVIYVEQIDNQPVVSDWLIGFGLPGNRHVAYQVMFRECLVGDAPEEELPGCSVLLVSLADLLTKIFKR